MKGLAEFLELKKEDTFDPHSHMFGDKYKQSVEEAMSITGVIDPEYKKPLEDLKERLGLPNHYTRGLFLNAVESRMKPMVEWLVSEMERTVYTKQQIAQKSGKDLGEDYFRSGKQADVSFFASAWVGRLSPLTPLS